jgi:hypothetical protein
MLRLIRQKAVDIFLVGYTARLALVDSVAVVASVLHGWGLLRIPRVDVLRLCCVRRVCRLFVLATRRLLTILRAPNLLVIFPNPC